MEHTRGQDVIVPLVRKSDYSSSEDQSLQEIEDNAEFKKFMRNNHDTSKIASKNGVSGMNLTGLQEMTQSTF